MMLRKTISCWLFGLLKIPLILYVRPRVIQVDNDRCEVKVPLTRRTRNHWKSMYLGALAIGADLAAGLILMEVIKGSHEKVSFIFKDFTANFMKRPEADVHFICKEGHKIRQAVEETIQSRDRVNATINISEINSKGKRYGPTKALPISAVPASASGPFAPSGSPWITRQSTKPNPAITSTAGKVVSAPRETCTS